MTVKIALDNKIINCEKGTLLGDVMELHDVFEQPCGGKKKCGKCLVSVKGELSDYSHEELTFLTVRQRENGVRLACCCSVEGDCEVISQQSEVAVSIGGYMPSFEWQPAFERYAIAVDIGTTTLALQMYSTESLVAEVSEKNPQAAFGADVISRIEHALAGEGKELAQCIIDGISRLTEELLQKSGVLRSEVDLMVITGNTTMLYLLTQRSPEPLSHAPFEADHLFGENLPKGWLSCLPTAEVYLPRCISAFIGADISTAILSSDLCNEHSTALLMDVGTNGELALRHDGKLFCCSTAMGPAFEGATLSSGMIGKTGAVHKVELIDGQMHFRTIGDAPVIGICGSGVVDLVACLLKTEQLEDTGLLEEDVMLADEVYFTQKDIRMVQLAKAAVAAGVEALLAQAGLEFEAIEQLYLAGGFGSNLNIENAAEIGLVPKQLIDRVTVLGNAALSGAAMLLLNKNCRTELEQMIADATTHENSTDPVFNDAYIDNMMF